MIIGGLLTTRVKIKPENAVICFVLVEKVLNENLGYIHVNCEVYVPCRVPKITP